MPTAPSHPFLASDLPDLGMTRDVLRRMVASGEVSRVFRAAYVPAGIDDNVAARAALLLRLLPSGHVVSGRTASWLWGVDTYAWSELGTPPSIDVCVLPGAAPTRRRGAAGHTRDLHASDVQDLDGVLVTTPLRTALDLGCVLRPREAMAALDMFARLHDITSDRLSAELPRFKGRRGVRQLRDLVSLVDPRIESVRESWVKYEIHAAGLPMPDPQYWIEVDGVPTYRLDFAYPHRRTVVEYDGFDAHERTPEQKKHDEERRDWLRRNGWTVIVVRRGDFTGTALDRWIDELRTALAPSYSPLRKLERGTVRG
jgi:hypothetical protein